MLNYCFIIKLGNLVKFFPRELEGQAIAILGAEPTIKVLGDNQNYDQSRKVDCKPFDSYIGIEPIADDDFERIKDTNVRIPTSS